MAKVTLKPGEKVPKSGIYKTPSGKETTLLKGGKAPPTPEKGQSHKLVRGTNDRLFGFGPKKNKQNRKK